MEATRFHRLYETPKEAEVIQETGENLKSQQIQQHKIPLTAECVPKQAQNKFG